MVLDLANFNTWSVNWVLYSTSRMLFALFALGNLELSFLIEVCTIITDSIDWERGI